MEPHDLSMPQPTYVKHELLPDNLTEADVTKLDAVYSTLPQEQQ